MCFLLKWSNPKKQPPSAAVSVAPSKARSRPRVTDKSIAQSYNSANHTNSSKDSSRSSGSATSLTNIREMLSDGPIIFQFRDLCKATDNFSALKKVGTTVYRGNLQKTDMAIVVDTRKGAGGDNFAAEIKNLGSIHHANLVRLLGGCINGEQVYLVYDYINGGNLWHYLHSNISPGFSALPTWMSRIQVALEISKGLEYLHHHTHVPTLHKYIKSTNILLDDDLHARIAFFGVAKIRGELGALEVTPKTATEEGEIVEVKPGNRGIRRSRSIKITGTHGYMAPEYLNGGVISPKLDVFAFGVVLLEILSGKKAVSFQASAGANALRKTLLTEVIMSIFEDKDPKCRIRAWIDPVLRDDFPLDCALKAAKLARSCVDPVANRRPDMSNVSMTLLQIQMSSKIWDDKMKNSKDVLTTMLQAR
ncbi:lysM domain receptor-like kinase 3 isoform X2 [Physcomitrium patens]|uniref:Protein kinase domain-containing protein n=2 Tax=Physcomitrium patens TaxID=3218 RepID=A0A2K1JDG9_PHYPA|nr:lysM domain receptor-like kinase 3 isoform X2 [Physcomitrium patens]PNR39570.1 hypothetical protein PHYPA_019849 [Physcomitrium patens]|eukprot:XP_024395875.1 lysM domain receptor-like kinase 3 isoform X2 [Physcomitrella patens]